MKQGWLSVDKINTDFKNLGKLFKMHKYWYGSFNLGISVQLLKSGHLETN